MKQTAFSLIELLISLVVVGIITALCYPSYQEHLVKTKRMEAKTALFKLAAELEKYYTDYQSYRGAGVSRLNLKHYWIQVKSDSDQAYTLQAAPKHEDKACGNLLLDESGHTHATGTANETCW